MNATELRPKRQFTLPLDVCQAAGLSIYDQVDWRFENGEIRGKKLVHPPQRKGRVLVDPKTGLSFWDGDITPQEAEDAALSANVDRE